MKKRSYKKKKIYSNLEKSAFYTGFGVGLTGAGSTTSGLTRNAFNMMSDKEKQSYINGYSKGLDNVSIKTGMRNNKKFF